MTYPILRKLRKKEDSCIKLYRLITLNVSDVTFNQVPSSFLHSFLCF